MVKACATILWMIACTAIAEEPKGLPAPWPTFRGDAALRGVAEGKLPEKPALLWSFKTEGPIASSPVIGRGKAFIGSSDSHVYAIDLKTGKEAWRYKADDMVESPPTLHGDALLAGGMDGSLYCLDADKGTLRWKYQTQDKIVGAAVVVKNPADDRFFVLAGSFDTYLHCVDLATGKEVWKFETGAGVNTTPTVVEGKVIFGGCDGFLHVVSIEKGEKISEIEIGNPIAGSAAAADGRLYFGHFGNEFIAVDLKESKIAWAYKEKNFPYYSSPAVGEKLVVVGGRDKKLHGVNRETGEGVWTFATRGGVDSSPVIVGDRVVFGSEDGRIYIVSLAEGKELWSYEIGKAITGSPGVAGGVIVIGSEDGNVYAFGEKKED